jgi:hypothetical protein
MTGAAWVLLPPALRSMPRPPLEATDRVAGRAHSCDGHTRQGVERDGVRFGGVVDPVAVGADDVPVRRTGNQDPVAEIGPGGGAGRVGADAVALDPIATGGAVQSDPALPVARDDVPLDEVAAPRRDENAVQGVAQRRSARGVEADQVAHDLVVAVGDAGDAYAVPRPAGDDVPGPRGRPADHVVAAFGDEEAEAGVGHGGGAISIRADVVALHHVVRRGDAGDGDPLSAVPRDDVALRGGQAADPVVRGVRDHHAGLRVTQAGRAGGVGADEVAGNHVVRRAGAVHEDAAAVVTGDQVAGARGRAANGVGGGVLDPDAVGRVAQIECPGPIRAD